MENPEIEAVLKQWTDADEALRRCILETPMCTDDRLTLVGEILVHSSFHMRALSRALTNSGIITPEQKQWFVEHAIEVVKNVGIPVEEIRAKAEEEKAN